jgi:AraC-like DNA-binding protein
VQDVLQVRAAKNIEHSMRAGRRGPIYQSGGDLYQIDGCGPQLRAIESGQIEFHALSHGVYPGKRMNSNGLRGLSSVGFWNCRRGQDWGLEPHRNEGLELVFLETGGMGFEVDGRFHSLHAGSLTVTRPWQLHKLGDPHIGRGRLYWLILDVGVRRPNQEWAWPEWVVLNPADSRELTRKLRRGEQAVWMASRRMKDLFRDVGDCVTRWGTGRTESRLALAVNGLLLELLEVLAEQQSVESAGLGTRRRTVELFLKDLAENPLSCAEPWSLRMMAEHCGMGITAISKYCRELVNNGPMAYLNLCRLEHAGRRLTEDLRAPVIEVAMEAGFNSSQYFATLFRERFGVTPREYRVKRRGG